MIDDSFEGKIMVLPRFGDLVEGTENLLLLPQLLPVRSTYFAVAAVDAADIQQETQQLQQHRRDDIQLAHIVLPSLHMRPNLGLRFVVVVVVAAAAAETTQKRRGSVKGHHRKPILVLVAVTVLLLIRLFYSPLSRKRKMRRRFKEPRFCKF